jgi:hypothetical protein
MYYKHLTPEHALEWLLKNGKEAEPNFYANLPKDKLVEAVGENLRDFGMDADFHGNTLEYEQYQAVSIGYYREDEDFAILATLNNSSEDMPREEFDKLVKQVVEALQTATNQTITALVREDAPDYLNTDVMDEDSPYLYE